MSLIRITAAAAIALLSATAQATPVNLVGNGNFDSSVQVGGGGFCYTNVTYPGCAISGWSGSIGTVLIGSNNGAWDRPANAGGNQGAGLGAFVVGLQGDDTSLSQVITASGGNLFSYTLTWFDAGRNNAIYQSNTYDVFFDGVALGAFTTGPGQAWGQHTLRFVGDGSGKLNFVNRVLPGDHTSFLDQVSMTAAVASVPEPGCLALVGAAALAGLALRRRRA